MRGKFGLRAITALICLSLCSMGFAQAAQAGVIGTHAIAGAEQRAAQVERLQSLVASEDVTAKLVVLGVDPEWAAQRVASLTDAELARLNAEIEQMPAGAGVVTIVGITFIVLLILELTGVIDIFKKI
ncbi:MAG: PA2779 family protein [Chromatiales bacterium]|nr:PA2779 family protein [Chromatiales bacterium]MDH4031082.1 PA2779 family protein [Chromatiales bacterium]